MVQCNEIECKCNAMATRGLRRYGAMCTRSKCFKEERAVMNVLENPVTSPLYNVWRLADDQLKYCQRHEKRKSGLRKLDAEAHQREKCAKDK